MHVYVSVALVYYIHELFRKTGFIPFWITESTIRNRRWRRWSKIGDLHLVWMVTDVLIGRHLKIWIMSGDRPGVRGDRRVCKVYSASGFVQTQNGLANGRCVWHWNLFCVIDSHQLHGVNCLCGMLRCSDQGFCWKAKSCGWWSKHDLCGISLCNV